MNQKELRIFLLATAVLLLIGNAWLAITDPVESNYALTAREMLESGDYISPRIYGSYWYDKPIFFYWELILGFKIFGVNEFGARFFPAVFALLNVGLVYWFAKKLYGAKTAFCSALIFSTTTSFFYLSKAVITDMAFIFFFNAVLVSFYMAYSSGCRRLYLASFFFAGLATLTKGPIGILMPGLILLIFLIVRKRPGELLRMMWLPGMAIFCAICYWYYQMYELHGSDFITNFFGVHNFLRATVSEHSRDDVWYYYTMIFLLGFFPWSFLMLCQIKRRFAELREKVRARKVNESVIFLVLWAFLVNALFQMMATKYITYTQPAFLPLAILAGCLLSDRLGMVRKVAIGAWIFYMVATFAAAVPLCEQRSGRQVAEALIEANPEHHLVINLDDYPTSVVFYYHENIPEVAWRDSIDSRKPGGISWNAKNVMPFIAYEDIPVGKPLLVICTNRKIDDLKRSIPQGQFRPLRTFEDRTIFELIIPDEAARPKAPAQTKQDAVRQSKE